METKETIGIDVSKLTLDCHDHNSGSHKVFDNTPDGIAQLVLWSLDASGSTKGELLFVLEHTGLYAHKLIQCLGSGGHTFHVAAGLEIKRSMGIARGKDDRADAGRIARYGHEKRKGP